MRRARHRTSGKKIRKKKPEEYNAACSVCGAVYRVPVAPSVDRELTCLSCMQTAVGRNEAIEALQKA